MALFVFVFLIIYNCLNSLLGSEDSNGKVLEIKSTTITANENVRFYKVDETLNLTCIFRNETNIPDVVLEWVVLSKASNSQNHIINRPGTNYVVLIIENLQENDSGEYKCKAVHNGVPFFISETSVRIKVKNKKLKECNEVMFQCAPGICISKRYTCDGVADCPQGEDESPTNCGPGNPCDNKLKCPDISSRCIPVTWCCESHREPNCTTKIKHSCCSHVEKLTRDVDNDMGFQYEQQRFSDMGFLQTTVYTVIGCVMAFMFIVTIIVIAICRVHVRRTLLSRCPATGPRNCLVPLRRPVLGRGGNLHGNNLDGLSLYDLDLYLNRSVIGGNDLMSVNPLLVTYNINNGVQFVGRPVDPPPYCEIVTAPPKEGPPPPYASRENLTQQQRREDEYSDQEVTESDALLADCAPSISVISCNAIDVVPQQEEAPPVEDSDAKNNETAPKESPDAESSSDSSHCAVDGSKFAEDSKNVNIIVVENRDPVLVTEASSTFKMQAGEPSSYPDVSDISKGAVRKMTDSSRRKSKSLTKKF